MPHSNLKFHNRKRGMRVWVGKFSIDIRVHILLLNKYKQLPSHDHGVNCILKIHIGSKNELTDALPKKENSVLWA